MPSGDEAGCLRRVTQCDFYHVPEACDVLVAVP